MPSQELIERCNDRLKQIADAVQADDRKAAMGELKVGYWTVHRYLNGNVKNVDLGVKLYSYLKNLIDQREQVLS